MGAAETIAAPESRPTPASPCVTSVNLGAARKGTSLRHDSIRLALAAHFSSPPPESACNGRRDRGRPPRRSRLVGRRCFVFFRPLFLFDGGFPTETAETRSNGRRRQWRRIADRRLVVVARCRGALFSGRRRRPWAREPVTVRSVAFAAASPPHSSRSSVERPPPRGRSPLGGIGAEQTRRSSWLRRRQATMSARST